MKNVLKTILVTAGTVMAASVAQANLIQGSVNMSGNISVNSTSLYTATAATNFSAANVSSGTLNYANTAPAAVAWNVTPVAPLRFYSTATPEVIANLWSFSANGENYTFSLSSILGDNISTLGQEDTLTLAGIGTLTETGTVNYTPTTGNFSLTITDSSGGTSGQATFGFASSDTAAVPDGGLTVALMGGALLGLGAVRRKLGC